MSVIAIVPFLEAIGVTSFFTTSAELVVGEGVLANISGGAATGYISGKIGNEIDGSVKSIFKDKVEDVSSNVSDYFNMGSGAFVQDPTYFLAKEKHRQDLLKKQRENPSKNLNTTIRIGGQLGPSSSDKTIVINGSLGGVSDKSDYVAPSKLQTISNLIANPDAVNPRDLARLVIDVSKKLSVVKDLKEANLEVLQLEPQDLSLSQKVTAFLAKKSLPNSDEYKKISSVYNGRNITLNNFSISRNSDGLVEVTGIDETGSQFVLPETTGISLPAVPGYIFVGPLSKNNKLPTDNVEDFFAYFHDYSWRNGNFNKKGDLQFISRLAQNLDRVRPENSKFVQATIIYFSNVSLNLSMMTAQPEDDIFSNLGGIDKSDPNYEPLRTQFYTEMNQELTSYTKTDGFFTSYKDTRIKDLLEGFEIQIN